MTEEKKYYFCGECQFVYEDKEWKDKCEQWCKEHHSCSIEITKNSINLKDR